MVFANDFVCGNDNDTLARMMPMKYASLANGHPSNGTIIPTAPTQAGKGNVARRYQIRPSRLCQKRKRG